MASLRTEFFAECGNLFIFCKIISGRQQILNQVQDDGYLYIFGSSLPTCLLQAGLLF
jgi:hypothetical protein